MPRPPSDTHAAPPERERTTGSNPDGGMNALRPIELPPLPENPLVSVLVANYNYARFIGEAIQSVLDQTYGNFELVICDDGSTDNSVEVIESFARRDPRVRLVRQQNGGMASALNTAYRESKGEIICLLDSDDRCLPEKLQTVVVQFAESPQAGFLTHKLIRIDAEGRQGGVYPLLAGLPSGWYAPEVIRNAGETPKLPPCSGLCLRRQVTEAIFPIPATFRSGADAVVQALASLSSLLVGVDTPLAEWREHGANLTTTASITGKWIDREIQIQEQIWELQKRYLHEVSPELAHSLAPAGERVHTQILTYLRARLAPGTPALPAYRSMVASGGLERMAMVNRYFWKISILLPSPVFWAGFRFVHGQGAVKRRVWELWAALRRTPRSVAY